MTQTTHTPGPWEIDDKAGSGFDLDIIAQDGRVAMIECDSNEHKLGDARLIAAAPELLDLLEQNLTAWDEEENSVKEEHAELIEATREAIAKATGQAVQS